MSRLCFVVLSLGLSAAGCNESVEHSGRDADGADARPDAVDAPPREDVEAPEASVDGDVASGPGPITLVVTEVFAIEDRLCDLDGNGSMDNSIADLGGTVQGLFLMTLNQTLTGFIEEEGLRMLMHVPWVDDLAGPDASDTELVFAAAFDVDQPPEPSNDFDGDGAFYPRQDHLDSCGEPIFSDPASLTGGELIARSALSPIAIVAPTRDARFTGAIAPGGNSAEVDICSVLLISDLGPGKGFPMTGDLSTLEVLLAGGAAYGIAGVPGLEPDLDLDGDGLERFVTDEANHIVSCIDGDSTEIPGRDCWSDERMADGVSLNATARAVSARLVAPGPIASGVEAAACPSPPSPSLWAACASAPSAPCARGETRSCSPGCGGGGVEQCSWDCSGWQPCRGEGVSSWQLDGCASVLAVGTGASCLEGDPSVQLVDGAGQARGVRFGEPLVVGTGHVVLRARIEADHGTSGTTGYGWALVAYTDEDEDFLSAWGGAAGVDYTRRGYGVHWYNGHPGLENPSIAMLRSFVAGENSSECLARCSIDALPRLAPSTPGPVTQGMMMVITPDLPETEENEMAVSGHLLHGTEPEWIGTGCLGDDCPVQIRTGDSLQVGITSATGTGYDASLRVVGPAGLSAEVHGPCP